MQLCTAVAATPHYTLLADDNLPLGPSCLATEGTTSTAIYGFTNREAYDGFRGDSRNPWRPYPLVSRHLERMLTQPGLQLVVLDACGPNEPCLAAGTAEAVLAAQASGAQQLRVAFYLSHSHDADAYQIERAPVIRYAPFPLPASFPAKKTMNWDAIKREWQGVSGQIMLTWGKFSEDDLVFIGGDRDRFIDLYAQHYGGSDAKVISRVDDFARSQPPPSPPNAPDRRSRR